jgi:hypothetical protein
VSEKKIMNDTLMALSALPETMVWRNNTGQAWAGKRANVQIGSYVQIKAGMALIMNAQPVSFGLLGSADIIGCSAGTPLAVEIKDLKGRQSEQQKLFQSAWTRCGGVYILARDPQDALTELKSL